MPHIIIQTHPVGHVIDIQGTQEEVTTLLALAILGSERLKSVILDALDAQAYLIERGCKALPVEGKMVDIDNADIIN